MLYILIGCLIIIAFLGYKLYRKQEIDKSKLNQYIQQLEAAEKDLADLNKEVDNATLELRDAHQKTEYEKYKLEECKKDLQAALDTYNDVVDNKMKEIDDQLNALKTKRNNELEELYNSEKKRLDTEFTAYVKEQEERKTIIHDACIEAQQNAIETTEMYRKAADDAEILYESLLEPIKQYQKTKQEKLFYTIQLPEEYQNDIEFLLTTVAAKVQHPDIISKLVWAEYVKPNLDNTFKRIEIKAEPGIYKLTSLENGMSYIGKSTNVKNRIQDHFKSSVGLTTISDQAVHHAICKEGFWNWSIEIITYCDKDKLGELEKYYIEFFKTQEYGYNKRAGG